MSSNSHQSDSSQGGEANNSFSSHDLDSTQLIARLLYLQQRPSRQSHEVLETFCHEVTLIRTAQGEQPIGKLHVGE